MNTPKRSVGRRLVAALGAAALSLVGIAGVASAADTVPVPGPGQTGAPETGTLIIHKYAGSTTGQDHNGTEQDVSRPPLQGVPFTAQRIGTTIGGACVAIDLTTSAGWTAVSGITADPRTVVPCNYDGPLTGTTDATGVITWEDEPLGLYYVTEGDATSVGVTGAAEPFYVTLPYPSTTGSGAAATTQWLYTVHVYPKNTTEGVGGKTVADPTANGLGATVPWTITTRPLGTFDSGEPLTTYKIIDQMVDDLQYTGTTSLLYKLPGGALTTVNPNYYVITKDPADAATPGGTVTVEFNHDGLAWINTLQAGTVFQWDLTTTVVGVGALENKSFENTGHENVTTGSAKTDWGAAKLLKYETNDLNKVLSGAIFKVYNSTDGVCTRLGTEVSVQNASEFVSDDAGVVDIPGLYVGKNGETESRVYCVVETKAPAGYTLDGTPKAITVTPGAVAADKWSAKVPNLPTTGPDLPLTGANGQLLALIGGGSLVLLAAGTALVARKRSHQD